MVVEISKQMGVEAQRTKIQELQSEIDLIDMELSDKRRFDD